MTLIIGNTDYTACLREGTLSLRHYGALRSSFSATLNPRAQSTPLAGEEIRVLEGSEVLWGGILIETEAEYHSSDSATVTLRGQGYEHLLQRYCFPLLKLEEMTPSEATEHIFSTYLNTADGLSLGEIHPGSGQKNAYTFYPAKASSVFDYLAGESGYRWWVDKSKTFSMQRTLPHSAASVSVDLTGKAENALADLQTFLFRSSTAGYRNVQYAFNKNREISGKAIDIEGSVQMQSRYGSGHYGAVAGSSVVYTVSEATTLAEQILQSAPGTDEIEFSTDFDDFALGQEIAVTAPLCGIPEARAFTVSEIRAVYFFDRFRYTVTATQSAQSTRSVADWEWTLAGNTLN